MTRPTRYLLNMILFIALVIGVVILLLPQLQSAFEANRVLNGVILAVLVIGILNNLRQVLRLNPEVTWIEEYRAGEDIPAGRQPKLLSPMAAMLGERRGGRISLSAPIMRSILDSIGSRLDESREISRYAIGLLVFLGLLGTFWGLLGTVSSVSSVISNLSVAGGDVTVFFDDLKKGLNAPLSGMGTAFSSSLFGLAGSLVLGFLDLQAGQAQNRFYNDLEEWLSSVTRLGGSSFSGGEGDVSNVPAYMQALMEQMADNMEHLRRSIELSEESRMTSNVNIMALAESVNSMTDQMRTEQSVLMRLAESQKDIRSILSGIAEAGGTGGGMDDRTKSHIRNLDTHMARLVEESSTGRERTINELRSEIKLLARTMAAIAEEQRRPGQ